MNPSVSAAGNTTTTDFETTRDELTTALTPNANICSDVNNPPGNLILVICMPDKRIGIHFLSYFEIVL